MKKHFNIQTFETKEEAEKWVKLNRKKKYVISELADKSGWLVAFNEWY